jgi:hypothetical protein
LTGRELEQEGFMRGVSKSVVRGVLAGSFALLLAVPAQARPRDGGDRWFERKLDPIAKVLKRFVIKSTGDGLSDPRPWCQWWWSRSFRPEGGFMRDVSKSVVRVLAGSIVLLLAMPAQAKSRDGGRWFERKLDPIVKVIKKLVFKSTGDGLIDPRPW